MAEHDAPSPGRTPDEEWTLRTTDREPWLRGYLGNGRLSMQLVADGGLAGVRRAPLHLMAELYDRAEGHEVEHPVALPDWSGLRLSADGCALDPDGASEYGQTLDLRGALTETRFVWNSGDLRVEAVTTQVVLRHEPNLALVRLHVRSNRDCRLEVKAALHLSEMPVWRAEGADAGFEGDLAWVGAATRERDIPVAVAALLSVDGSAATATHVAGEVAAEGWVGLTRGMLLRAGELRAFTLYVAAHSSYTAADPQAAARADATRAAEQGASPLLAAHRAAWERLWRADIQVEGDPAVQRFVRAGLFGLLCSIREDVAASVSPMGLSSLGYNGHIFWDADTWMYPPLLLLHPELAEGMLTYRQRRLPAALARARDEGYEGAMFPWESATDGSETTPSFARTGLKEHHITACVALAQWQYYLATGDRAWLAERGWPILDAAARFWVSRATANDAGGYEIHDVIAADEYAEDVDNNAFTNAAARAALLAAITAARDLGRPAPDAWQRVADGLVLPRDGHLVLEFDGYDGRVIKQADVELLTYPLEYPLAAESIRANLDTYRRATDPEGPAMGKSMSAVVAAQLGRREEALALFHGCYQPNLCGPFYALAETPSNGAVNFLTGVGGALQSLLFGIAGLRLHEDALAVDPLLPVGWGALRFPRLRWRGRDIALAILPGDLAAIGLRHEDLRLEIVLQRYRPGGQAPLVVELRGAAGLECVLKAEDWQVEPQFGAEPGWRLWPPGGVPTRPFVRLQLTALAPRGAALTFAVEQRVREGDI
jgi:trehalose/maltose hydrolase-like predicted phosphorylase